MFKKLASVGFFALLMCHTLACVLVCVAGWWQAEDDLSERLVVYRSVDSIVEFEIPLKDKTDGSAVARTTEDGFRYRGQYFTVMHLEMQGDTLHIAGVEADNHSFWQDDLLSFLNEHLAASSETGKKANQLLKFLLKEYSPSARTRVCFVFSSWRESIRIPEAPLSFSTRSAPIHSPPPELIA